MSYHTRANGYAFHVSFPQDFNDSFHEITPIAHRLPCGHTFEATAMQMVFQLAVDRELKFWRKLPELSVPFSIQDMAHIKENVRYFRPSYLCPTCRTRVNTPPSGVHTFDALFKAVKQFTAGVGFETSQEVVPLFPDIDIAWSNYFN